jgi:hypothetical protein
MIDRSPPSAPSVLATSAIAAGGMLAHNVLEFGPAFLIDPQTLIPLGIFAVLAILAARAAAGPATWLALLAWGTLNLVGGGILSVLPIGLFPFQPEKTIGHYSAHVLYALAQVPVLVVAWSGSQAARARSAGANVPDPSDVRSGARSTTSSTASEPRGTGRHERSSSDSSRAAP